MKTIQCPNCDEALSRKAKYCPRCGESPTSLGKTLSRLSIQQDETGNSAYLSQAHNAEHPVERNRARHFLPGGRRQRTSTPMDGDTWQRIHPGLITSSLATELQDEPQSIAVNDVETPLTQQETWQKVVETPSNHTPASYPPRPPQSHAPWRFIPYARRLSPVVLFWISIIVLLLFVGGGVFGISKTLGHPSTNHNLSLQVNPHTAAIGAIITLRGANFTPSGHVGLTRDNAIPLVDSGGAVIIQADKQGNFTDTVLVTADWGDGSHTINAEDAFTHKTISFPIIVVGHGSALRPAHLALTASSLNLGSGDQATNTMKTLTLTNDGSGQIIWSSSTSQSWLLISPQSGTLASGMHEQIAIAADRAGLPVGSYTAHVLFSSNVGNITLPINMQVTALQAGNYAVLELAPAVLSFNGSDDGPTPTAQTITISDPGVFPLSWQATSNASWLTVSPGSGSIEAAGDETATVSVNTSTLLPGTYHSVLTFQAQSSDGVLHSIQSIYVSITIVPRCSLQVTPAILAFTAASQQATPASKTVSLSASASCAATLKWTATKNASWLTLSSTSGTTPTSLTIGIASAGLQTGVYNSSITFSSASGTQIVLVSFAPGQTTAPETGTTPTAGTSPPCTLQSPSVAEQDFAAQVGTNPATQSFTAKVGGSCNGNVTITPTVPAADSGWLSVTNTSGPVLAGATASFTVQVTSANLTANNYSSTITLTGSNGGQTITGSPQTVSVHLEVDPAPTLTVNTPSLNFDVTGGSTSQSVTIGSASTQQLNWTAALSADAPAFVSLTTSSGNTSSTNNTLTVTVNATNATPGTYSATITISGTNASSGATAQGTAVAVTITVAQPALQLSSTNLTISTAGVASQPIVLSNAGGGILTWSVGVGSLPGWLSVDLSGGSNVAGASTQVTFSADATGLTTSPAPAEVTIIPSVGPAQIVTVTLIVASATPTDTSTVVVSLSTTPTPSAEPTAAATNS